VRKRNRRFTSHGCYEAEFYNFDFTFLR